MKTTTSFSHWVHWLTENKETTALENLITQTPELVTPAIADLILNELGGQQLLTPDNPDMSTQFITELLTKISDQTFQNLTSALSDTQLLNLTTFGTAAERLPAETRQNLLTSPYGSVRAVLGNSQGLTRTERLQALTDPNWDPPTKPETGRLWMLTHQLSGNASSAAIHETLTNLGNLTEAEQRDLFQSPILWVNTQTRQIWQKPGTTVPGNTLGQELINWVTHVQQWDKRTNPAPHPPHAGPQERAEELQSLRNHLKQLTILSGDGEPIPTGWLTPPTHTKDTADYQHLLKNAKTLIKHHHNQKKWDRIRIAEMHPQTRRPPAPGAATDGTLETWEQFLTNHPRLTDRPVIWEYAVRSLTVTLCRSQHQKQEQHTRWVNVLTRVKPNWTTPELNSAIIKELHRNGFFVTEQTEPGRLFNNILDFYTAVLSAGRHKSDLTQLTAPILTEQWKGNPWPYPHTEKRIIETWGAYQFVKQFKHRFSAQQLIVKTPGGVHQYLTETWPNVNTNMFLHTAQHPQNENYYVDEICSMLT